MAVYVDDVRHPFRGMIMCHLWADTMPELYAMVDRIGVARRWIQTPPAASWVHFDISISKRKAAIAAGAILTDKYGPLEFRARQDGDRAMLAEIAKCRAFETEPTAEPDLFG